MFNCVWVVEFELNCMWVELFLGEHSSFQCNKDYLCWETIFLWPMVFWWSCQDMLFCTQKYWEWITTKNPIYICAVFILIDAQYLTVTHALSAINIYHVYHVRWRTNSYQMADKMSKDCQDTVKSLWYSCPFSPCTWGKHHFLVNKESTLVSFTRYMPIYHWVIATNGAGFCNWYY